MPVRRNFSLTFFANSGYLLALLPTHCMRNVPSSDLLQQSNPEANAKQTLAKRIQVLASSAKAKLFTAVMAAGAAVNAPSKAEATLVYPAEMIPGTQSNELREDELGLTFEGLQLRISNIEDETNRQLQWIGFRSMDDTEADAALPLPGHTPVPSQITGPNDIPADGVSSPELLVQGPLNVNNDFFLVVGVDENGNTLLGLDKYLEGSRFHYSFDELVGTPSDLDEAISMTDGAVYQGFAPSQLDPNELYVLRPTSVPEPSSALLIGGAAAAGLATRGRRRRKDQ